MSKKTQAVTRWYQLVSSIPGGESSLSAMRKVIYSYIHHSHYDFMLEVAYDALKELRDKDRSIATYEGIMVYAYHFRTCGHWSAQNAKCTCGFDAARQRLKELAP